MIYSNTIEIIICGDININYHIDATYKQSLDSLFKNILLELSSQKVYHKSCNKAWLTPGIKISCINERKLLLIQSNSNDPNLTNNYKR